MNFLERLSSLFSFHDNRNATEIEYEISEELQFHLESCIEDKIKQGIPKEIAEKEATQQFGSLKQYSNECRLINLGDHVLINRFLTAGVLLLGLLVGYLVLETHQLKNDQIVLLDKITSQETFIQKLAPAEPPSPKSISWSVSVKDGKPLSNVNLLIILKTWPDKRYQQQNFHTTTDANGQYILETPIPDHGNYALHISAFKAGYGFKSSYEFNNEYSENPVKPVNFKLSKSNQFTIQIKDKNGSPIKNVRIYPSKRKTSDGVEHLVYHQASKPIQMISDENGTIPMNLFAKGEKVEFRIQIPGKEWSEQIVQIPNDANEVFLIFNSKPNS